MKIAFHKFEKARINDMAGYPCWVIISIKDRGAYGVVQDIKSKKREKKSSRLPEAKQSWIHFLHDQMTKADDFDVIVFGSGDKLPQGIEAYFPSETTSKGAFAG